MYGKTARLKIDKDKVFVTPPPPPSSSLLVLSGHAASLTPYQSDKVFVTELDMEEAMAGIKCSSRRSTPGVGAPLPNPLGDALHETLLGSMQRLGGRYPPSVPAARRLVAAKQLEEERERLLLGGTPAPNGSAAPSHAGGGGGTSISTDEAERLTMTVFKGADIVYRPRFLLTGRKGDAQQHVARAVIQALDPIPCYAVDLVALHLARAHKGGGEGLEEVLVQRVAEARAHAPSVLYLPNLHAWWRHASDNMRNVLVSAVAGLPPNAPVLLLATADVTRDFDTSKLLGAVSVFTQNDVLHCPAPSESERAAFFRAMEREICTWMRHPSIAAPPPELAEDDTMPENIWKRPEDPQQKDREAKAMRGMRIKLREKCRVLLGNRRFKDFHYPVLDQEMDASFRASYTAMITHPMDLGTLLREIDRYVVRCRSHFMQRINLIRSNAVRFNDPDFSVEGPGSGGSPLKLPNGDEGGRRPHAIPDNQEQRLQVGSILECECLDKETQAKEWVPGKLVRVTKQEGGVVTGFVLDFCVENNRERGAWQDEYSADQEGKEWRWPSAQAAKASQQKAITFDANMARRVNQNLCSIASELVDVAEDEMEKLDSWLLEECERIVTKMGYPPPPVHGWSEEELAKLTNASQRRAGVEDTAVCHKCKRGDDEEKLLLCENFRSCECAYHIYCLTPPLKAIPESDWYCPACVRRRSAGALAVNAEVECRVNGSMSEWVRAKVRRSLHVHPTEPPPPPPVSPY